MFVQSPKSRWGWARTMSEDVQSAGSGSRPWPTDQPVIDTLIGFGDDPGRLYAGIRRSLRDRESLEELEMPAGYMFHDLPPRTSMDEGDPVEVTVGEMDRFGIRTGPGESEQQHRGHRVSAHEIPRVGSCPHGPSIRMTA